MKHRNNKTRFCPALTLLEMVVAMAIIAIIFAVLVPQLRALQNSLDTKTGNSEVLQNSRVLIDHIQRRLTTAARITAVSDSSETNGYIEFEDNDDNELRYDVNSTSSYVEFGDIGSLSDLAGPVSLLQFTCYDACDLDTPLNPITDPGLIRCVSVRATLTNSASMGQGRTLTTCCYIRTNFSGGSGLVGWWKLDETSGLIAEDSSGYENNGTLTNMAGNEWTAGVMGGALEFDGANEYVDLPIDSVINSLSDCTITSWVNWSGLGSSWQRIWDFGSGEDENMFLTANTGDGKLRFAITLDGWTDEDQTTAAGELPSGWHHVVVTIDQENSTHTLYLDGEVAAENTSARYTPSDLGNTSNNWLARSQYAVDPYFDGLIDDVRIYNRVLEPEEIAELANILRFVDFTEAKAASDTTSITIPTVDTNEGDLLIAAIATDGDTSSSLTPPVGEGWSEIDVDDYGHEVTLGAWWKLADASESSSHQFTWSGAQQAYGWMMHFTGHNSSDPINDYSTDGESSSTPDSPEVTATVNNCLILRLGAFDDDDIALDNPGLSGHTAITMDYSGSSAGQVVFQSYAEASSAGGTSIIVNKPSGTVLGDLLIASFVSDGSSTLSAPGGWTLVEGGGVNPVDNTPSFGVWYKIAGASEPSSYTFSSSANVDLYIAVLRYTGHNPVAPINASGISNSTGSSTPTAPSVTTTVVNCKILRVFGADDDDTPYSAPGGHTARYDGVSNTGNGTCGGAGADTDQASAGATGTAAFSQGAWEEWRAVTVAIAPAIVGGSTVSGGAGYVRLPTDGDSGTSEFLLGSSNQAQMLTIAIAPENEGGGDGGGGVSP